MLPLFPLAVLGLALLVSEQDEPESFGAVTPPDTRPLPEHRPLQLEPLPYSIDALEPWQSAETIRLHHGELQAGYVKKTNAGIKELSRLRRHRDKNALFSETKALVSNTSGALLHQMYWKNLSPQETPIPPELVAGIRKDFGSVKNFAEAFSDVALSIVGSGWAVLAYSPFLEQMVILPVSNHDQYLIPGSIPLLVCDVWEHAYYLDHPADRASYVTGFWSHVNWPVVAKRLQKAIRN